MVPPKKRLSLANETKSTPQNDSPKPSGDGATPRTTRRRSVVAEEINAAATPTPSTPTRRGRRLSVTEALTEDNENGAGVATPTRRSRRLSGSLADGLPTVAVSTPTRRSRRLSGTDNELTEPSLVSADPLRRTRRTSGAGLDTPVDSPAPLGDTLRRTRRTSGSFTDINTDSPNAAGLKRSAPSENDNLVTSSKTPAKRGRRKSIVEEVIVEENEEAIANSLDVIKEDEEEKNDMDDKKEKVEEKEDDNPIIDIETKKKESNSMEVNNLKEKEEEKENDNPIIDIETNKTESNSMEVNEPANVTDMDKQQINVEEKLNSPKENVKDKRRSRSSIGTDLKIKPSEDIENKSVESEKMEVSETKVEDKSDTSVPSVAKSEDKIENSKIEVLNNKNEKNNNTMETKVIPRGMPKSGRFWKTEKKRFSSINAVKPLKTSWAKKMELKNQRKSFMAESAAIKEEKRLKKEALRERQALNKEQKDTNAKKAEVVQVIKDPRKIKKMKRKQLRYIETRDTSQPAKVM